MLRYSRSKQTSAGFHKTRDGYLPMKGFIRIDPERCKGCSWCMEHCPNQAIVLSNRLNLKGYFVADFADGKGCTGCAVCAVMCPEVAIEVYQLEKIDER